MSISTREPWLFEKSGRSSSKCPACPLVKGGQGRTDEELRESVNAWLSMFGLVVVVAGVAFVLFGLEAIR